MTTALLIDDEPEFLEVLKGLLERRGYSVLEAQDGSEGLRRVMEERPDIVVVDVMMPGINGWEVSRKIKNTPETRDIPVIILSVLANEDNRWKSFKYAGADWHVGKPFDTDMLMFILDLSSRDGLMDIEEKITEAAEIDTRMKEAYKLINPKLLDHRYDFLK